MDNTNIDLCECAGKAAQGLIDTCNIPNVDGLDRGCTVEGNKATFGMVTYIDHPKHNTPLGRVVYKVTVEATFEPYED